MQRFSCDVLDPNIYSAVDRGVQASVGPKGTCPEWILWVRTSPVDLNECALRAYTYQSFSPQSTLWACVPAILCHGRGIPAKLIELSKSSLVDKPCRVQIA